MAGKIGNNGVVLGEYAQCVHTIRDEEKGNFESTAEL
jgi:hypothetical protein